jgi:hypothetical protein
MRPFEASAMLPELLGEMSFGAYQDLGNNKILLVEGPSELTAVSTLLRRLRKDHEVVLVPMGGDATINPHTSRQLAELRRLSSEVGALIDSERTAEKENLAPARQSFVSNCRRLGIQCHVLDYRAFENYLPGRAIQQVKGEKYRGLAPFEAFDSLPLKWSKNENWRICDAMTQEEFDNLGDLGTFLRSFSSA